jgi:hypothetical protein
MGGWRSGGNCGGNACERVVEEDLREDDPNRWAPSISDGSAIMGWQAGSRVEMGRGQCRARPAAERMAHTDFFHFKSFSN